MLNVPIAETKQNHSRNYRRERQFWHDGRNYTSSLGCGICPDRRTCGGLCTERAFYDCLDSCCRQPESCDAVCRAKPREFAQRVREVGGFEFDNIPRATKVPALTLPRVVPVLFHGSSRQMPFIAPTVCLPLYAIIARHGATPRYANTTELPDRFRFQPGTPMILTGTANDRPLERWWSLGPVRLDEVRRLRDLGVVLVTTPNFSLFTDRPRWDDMHSMKRIAITHEEFLREGMAAALHVNARTERDWERWTEYITQRDEVTHVAFEFSTGAGWSGRMNWHAKHLAMLAHDVGRPLHLVVRKISGDILPWLVSAFDRTTVLDTTSFMKTIRRQRAIETASGRIDWESSPTVQNAPLDKLLTHNWSVVSRSFGAVWKNATVRQAVE